MKPSNQMKVIGITGGIGAGKSTVLHYVKDKYPFCKILVADEIGNRVKEPDGPCFKELISLLGNDILTTDGKIDRSKMAEKIFQHKGMTERVNAIIHPAVHETIERDINCFRKDGETRYVFLEAALLIEAGYVDELDDLWYVFSKESERRERLRISRGYSEARMNAIIEKQLKDDVFRKYAGKIIENNGTHEETYSQIDRIMEEYECQAQ